MSFAFLIFSNETIATAATKNRDFVDLPWVIRTGFDMKLSNIDLTIDQSKLEVPGTSSGRLHTDIPRLKKGGVGAQFWSVYAPSSVTGAEAIQVTLEQIDLVHQLCDKYPDVFGIAYTADDVRRVFKDGKIPSVCGIEGGHQIGGSLRALRMFRKLGARYMTLTHVSSMTTNFNPIDHA